MNSRKAVASLRVLTSGAIALCTSGRLYRLIWHARAHAVEQLKKGVL